METLNDYLSYLNFDEDEEPYNWNEIFFSFYLGPKIKKLPQSAHNGWFDSSWSIWAMNSADSFSVKEIARKQYNRKQKLLVIEVWELLLVFLLLFSMLMICVKKLIIK